MLQYHAVSFDSLSLTDLYDLLALREEVFYLEQRCTEEDLDGLDKNAVHVWIASKKNVIACARILPPDVYKKDIVSFGRLAIKKDWRGQGLGRKLMTYVLTYINEHFPNKLIEIAAQAYLQKFYESFGFKAVGQLFDEGGIPHIKMQLG